jgi:hypothetical protein
VGRPMKAGDMVLIDFAGSEESGGDARQGSLLL